MMVTTAAGAARAKRTVLQGALTILIACAGLPAIAADTIRISAQKTGTFAWELDVMRAHGLDTAAGLSLAVTDLASPDAGKLALNSGSADLILSDWLWVSRERSGGAKIAFTPYSSALGAIMVPPDSAIKTLADLKGKTLGVGGGAIDKSWLFLQGAALQDGLDLKKDAQIVYAAPSLLAEKAAEKEMDASLNFWNFCAALEAKGFRRVLGIEDILPKLGAKGRPSLVGYVFNDEWAASHGGALKRFLEATRKAKEILATSDAEWDRIAPLTGAKDAATLAAYRKNYRDGIPHRPIADEETDAATLYRVLAKLGGRSLVGDAPELAPGTFYAPPAER